MPTTHHPEQLPCLVCKKELKNVQKDWELEEISNQPSDGIVCISRGNHGSRAFDPPWSGHYIEFNICDLCLLQAREQGLIALGITPLPLRTWTDGLEYSLIDEALSDVHRQHIQEKINEEWGLKNERSFKMTFGSEEVEIELEKPLDKGVRDWLLTKPFTKGKEEYLERFGRRLNIKVVKDKNTDS